MKCQKLIIWTGMAFFFLLTACSPAADTSLAELPAEPAARPTEMDRPDQEPTVDFKGDLADFDSASFSDPTQISNPFFPLQPGSQLVFDGFTEEAGQSIPHSIVFTVTDLTKEIYGVQTVVAWVEDYSAGELVETELAFYAQDDEGNVWFLGEYPEVYENGKFVEAPAWISGYKGALPGIVMKVNPVVGEGSYSQGWGPAVDWTDRATVINAGDEVCVPVDCFEEVLVTEEFSESEPNAFQIKYYAPGVGNIKVSWRGDDANREELELVEYNQLEGDALASVRQLAMELEARAYEISKEVYDQTAPSR